MMSEPYVPTTNPVNIHSLENELYVVDYATVPGDLQPSLSRIIRIPDDSNGHTLLIEQSINTLLIDNVNMLSLVNGVPIGLNKYVLIKNDTDEYGKAINTPEPFISMTDPNTAATPFPPNVPGVPSFPTRGPIDAPPVPSDITTVADYDPNTNPTGGVSPYNYYVGHPYRDDSVIDIKKPNFGIYKITEIDTTNPVNRITLVRTRESLDLLPGSQIYVCLGNVNLQKQFIFTTTDEHFALCHSGNKPGFIYNDTVRATLTGSITEEQFAYSISSISTGTTVTITATGHNYSNGDWIIISGSDSTPSIDGYYPISNVMVNTFEITISPAVTVAGTTGNSSKAICGNSTLFLNEVKIGDTISLEVNSAITTVTATAIINQNILIYGTAFAGGSTITNTNLYITSTQSVLANYTLITAGSVSGDGSGDVISIDPISFPLTDVFTTGDKIYVNGQVHTIGTVMAASMTVSPAAGTFAPQQIYKFGSSSLITGRFTNFCEDSVLGHICIGSKLILDPFGNREEVTISAIINNTALIVDSPPIGCEHVCVPLEFCEESDITLKTVVAQPPDPLNIGKVNASECVTVCTDVVNIDCDGFCINSGTFKIGAGVSIVGQSLMIMNPLWVERYASNVIESYQITNWVTTAIKADGVTLAVPPEVGGYPTGVGIPPPLQIFSQDPTNSISFMGAGAGIYANTGRNNLQDINNITTIGTTTVNTLSGVGGSPLKITSPGGNVDFCGETIENIDTLELSGSSKITNIGGNLCIDSAGTIDVLQTIDVMAGANINVDRINVDTIAERSGPGISVLNNLSMNVGANLTVPSGSILNVNQVMGVAGAINFTSDINMNGNDILNIGTFTINNLTVNIKLNTPCIGNTGNVDIIPTGQTNITGLTVPANTIVLNTLLTTNDSGQISEVSQVLSPTITLPAGGAGTSYKFVLTTIGVGTVTVSTTGPNLIGTIIDTTGVTAVSSPSITFVGGTAAVGDSIEVYGLASGDYFVKAISSAAGGIA